MTNLPDSLDGIIAFDRDGLAGMDLESAGRVVRIAVFIDEHGDAARELGCRVAALVHDEKRWEATHSSWASWWSDTTGASPRTSYRWVDRGRELLGLATPNRETAGQSVPHGTPPIASHTVSPNGRAGGVVTIGEAPDPPPLPDLPPVAEPAPARPDTPQLNTVLDSMRSCTADVAGAIADDDQYREIVRWCRAFQETYQLMHPRQAPVTPAAVEVEPRFKAGAK